MYEKHLQYSDQKKRFELNLSCSHSIGLKKKKNSHSFDDLNHFDFSSLMSKGRMCHSVENQAGKGQPPLLFSVV